MISRVISLQSPLIRFVVSLAIAFHFFVLFACWMMQRDYSFLMDAFHSRLAAYTAVGNWRADITSLAMATATPLGEELSVEVHRSGADETAWEKLSVIHGPGNATAKATIRESEIARSWLLQLNGLLFYENEDMVGRMMTSALRAETNLKRRDPSIDKLRITVAARPNQDQYEQLKNQTATSEVREQMLSHTVYSASVVDLGDGQISLLPQLEKRRSSKAIGPAPSHASGAKP